LEAEIGVRIRIVREKMHLTQAAFAKKFGLEHQKTVSRIESGLGRLPIRAAVEILGHSGINSAWLLYGQEPMLKTDVVREDASERYLPVLGAASAAGRQRIAYDPEQVTGREEWPSSPHLVRVEGDSMIPVALPGQFVICTKDKPASGDLAVVQLAEDDELLFKRIYWQGDAVQLISINPDPKYPPRSVPRRAIRLAHKVWGVKF
jgi:SOS-response transcriptional repressor LexA